MLSGKKIIVGVTGSIAAYKAALLVRLLIKADAEVRVVMTEAASRFVAPLTFSNLSQHEVFQGLWDGSWSEHVHLGGWADAMVVAPCSAHTLGKMAHGICDNALMAVYLSAKCPVFVAPAMDKDMYIHPSTKRNLATLNRDGVGIVDSGTGFLASGLHGQGRLAEPEEIVAALEAGLARLEGSAQAPRGKWQGKKVLISAGPTREYLDPVRFFSNGSTGTMGYALSAAAVAAGAEVTLVSGPCNPPVDPRVSPIAIQSAQDLFQAMTDRAPQQDLVIMSAAVADYTPAETSAQKIKKAPGDFSIPMVRTRDVLKHLGAHKPEGQVLVGFALETQNGLENAQGKLQRKQLDLIVLNSLSDKGAGFGTTTNKVTLIDRLGGQLALPLKSKQDLAHDILDHLANTFLT